MTYSEYSRIMEVTEAQADNVMVDIDFMLESAEYAHKMSLNDLDYEFESTSDIYSKDTMTQLYLAEAKSFGDKVKGAWDKFASWTQGVKDSLFKKKPDTKNAKEADKKNPNGLKIPFDLKASNKALSQISGMVNVGYLKRMAKDINKVDKTKLKMNLSLKSAPTAKYSPSIDHFLTAGSSFVISSTKSAPCVASASAVTVYVSRCVDFSAIVTKAAQDIAVKVEDVPKQIMSMLKELLTTISTVVNACNTILNKTVNGAAENVDKKPQPKTNDKDKKVPVKESTSIDDGTVFAQFFESSDLSANNDSTYAFLESTDESLDELEALLRDL